VLEPGTRLGQEELAEVFGTSRAPVREALRALQYEGLVTSEPNHSSTVSRIDPDDIDELSICASWSRATPSVWPSRS
jgi:DNA-binding GntR family transcriptional regulator